MISTIGYQEEIYNTLKDMLTHHHRPNYSHSLTNMACTHCEIFLSLGGQLDIIDDHRDFEAVGQRNLVHHGVKWRSPHLEQSLGLFIGQGSKTIVGK